jgi:pseudouridine kinase
LKSTAAAGVKTDTVVKCAAGTGTYLAVLDNDGELVTAVSDMRAMDALTPAVVGWKAIETARLVVVDCNVSPELMSAVAARASGKMVVEPVSVAKCRRLAEALRLFPIFLATPNLDQVDALTGTRDWGQAAKMLHAMGLRNVVIHAGADGAFASDGKRQLHVPALAQNVIDVTGAGDAATAGLVAGLLNGRDLFSAARFGQEIAARVVASHNSTLE